MIEQVGNVAGAVVELHGDAVEDLLPRVYLKWGTDLHLSPTGARAMAALLLTAAQVAESGTIPRFKPGRGA